MSNANTDQLATIRSLIEIYDQPIADGSISARRFQTFTIRHAKASSIAMALKDVFRDLLSSKDKVFERPNGEQQPTSQSENYYYVYGNADDTDKKPSKVKASFAGALSVGVDETTNTIIVSAQEEWMPSITEMIRVLDAEAQPYRDTVQVVNTSLNGKSLKEALARMMSEGHKVTVKEDSAEPSTDQPKPPAEGKSETTVSTTE